MSDSPPKPASGGSAAPAPPDVFWGEIAPSEHLVQIYEADAAFYDALASFVAAGLRLGEAVIVIATPEHLHVLDERLAAQGVDLAVALDTEQYLPLSAEEVLDSFMENGWPDEERFRATISEIVGRAKRGGRRVRAFGEMVALLWSTGYRGATVRLEHIWDAYCAAEELPVFCAYPSTAFPKNATAAIDEICAAHSRVISGTAAPRPVTQ